MKPSEPYHNIVDSYFELLNNLAPDTKLELISRLSDSMKMPHKKKNGSWKDLFGAFESDKSAEEMIEEIRSARTFSRHREKL
jgi:hypothetical protein